MENNKNKLIVQVLNKDAAVPYLEQYAKIEYISKYTNVIIIEPKDDNKDFLKDNRNIISYHWSKIGEYLWEDIQNELCTSRS
jgi:hypothetical protein